MQSKYSKIKHWAFGEWVLCLLLSTFSGSNQLLQRITNVYWMIDWLNEWTKYFKIGILHGQNQIILRRLKEKKAFHMPIVLEAKHYILEGNYKMLSVLPNVKCAVYYAPCYSGGKKIYTANKSNGYSLIYLWGDRNIKPNSDTRWMEILYS